MTEAERAGNDSGPATTDFNLGFYSIALGSRELINDLQYRKRSPRPSRMRELFRRLRKK